jgi:chromosome segregation ATPase
MDMESAESMLAVHFHGIRKEFDGVCVFLPVVLSCLPPSLPLSLESHLEKDAQLRQARASEAALNARLAEQQARFDTVLHAMNEELTSEHTAHQTALEAVTLEARELKKREAEQTKELVDTKRRLENTRRLLADARTALLDALLDTNTENVKLQREMEETKDKFSAARFHRDSLARHAANGEIEKLQSEKEAAEAMCRRERVAHDASVRILNATQAVVDKKNAEIDQLKRELDNAVEDGQRLVQLQERLVALETRSPEVKKAVPRHPNAVPNSASAKGRARRSLSAGPSPSILDLTASADDEASENNQATVASTRKLRNGRTPKK